MSSTRTFPLMVAAISHQFAPLRSGTKSASGLFCPRHWSAASALKSFFIRPGCRLSNSCKHSSTVRTAEAGPTNHATMFPIKAHCDKSRARDLERPQQQRAEWKRRALPSSELCLRPGGVRTRDRASCWRKSSGEMLVDGRAPEPMP